MHTQNVNKHKSKIPITLEPNSKMMLYYKKKKTYVTGYLGILKIQVYSSANPHLSGAQVSNS